MATASVLKVALMFERQMWHLENPFFQFIWRRELIKIVKDKELTIDGVREMDSKELEILIQGKNAAKLSQLLKFYAGAFPKVELEATIQPITRTDIKVTLIVTPDFW